MGEMRKDTHAPSVLSVLGMDEFGAAVEFHCNNTNKAGEEQRKRFGRIEGDERRNKPVRVQMCICPFERDPWGGDKTRHRTQIDRNVVVETRFFWCSFVGVWCFNEI